MPEPMSKACVLDFLKVIMEKHESALLASDGSTVKFYMVDGRLCTDPKRPWLLIAFTQNQGRLGTQKLSVCLTPLPLLSGRAVR